MFKNTLYYTHRTTQLSTFRHNEGHRNYTHTYPGIHILKDLFKGKKHFLKSIESKGRNV